MQIDEPVEATSTQSTTYSYVSLYAGSCIGVQRPQRPEGVVRGLELEYRQL